MKTLYLILFSLFLVVSCKKNDIEGKGNDPVNNNSLKEKVLNYFNKKIAKVGDSAKIVIERLKSNVVWSDYKTRVSPRKEKQTIFRIISGSNSNSRISEVRYTSLYVIENSLGVIRSVSTVEIVVPDGNQQNPSLLTLELINNETAGYSGQLIKRNLSGYLIYQADINDGTLTVFKNLKKGPQQTNNGSSQRINECIDWYLQTYVNGILVSEVYLFTDCNGNVLEGSGGNNGGNNQNSSSPCEHAQALAQDSIFQAGAQFLRECTVLNYEKGLLKGVDINGNPVFQEVEGTPGNPYLPPLTINVRIDGLMHSHFAGGSSIFSPADLRALYEIYADSMANPGFVYTVVTANTSYSLFVEDLSAFLSYGQQHFEDELAFGELQLYTWPEYNIWELGSAASNEAGFVRLIAGEGMGLKLLSSNTTNFNQWEVKGLGLNNDVITIPC